MREVKLATYFKENRYTHETHVIVERADILDYMPYEEPKAGVYE